MRLGIKNVSKFIEISSAILYLVFMTVDSSFLEDYNVWARYHLLLRSSYSYS
jgi:hypothetical protein